MADLRKEWDEATPATIEDEWNQARPVSTVLGANTGDVSVTNKPTAISQDYPWRRKVMEILRPTIEGLGLLGGGAVGLGAGPAGAVAGAGLGYGMGRTVSDMTEEALGIRKPTPYGASALGRLHKGAKDVVSGSVMEMGGQILGKAAEPVAKSISTPSRHLTPEGKKALNIANQEGVYLSPADIKQTKGLALTEQVFFNAPMSATITQKQKLKTIKGLTDYRNRILQEGGSGTVPDYLGRKVQMEVDDYIKQLGLKRTGNINEIRDRVLRMATGQGPGAGLSYQELGKYTQDRLKQSSKELFDKAGAVYRSFYEKVPPDAAIPTSRLTATADRFLEEQMALPAGARDNKLIGVLSSYGSKEMPPEIAQLPPELQKQAMEQLGGLGNNFNPKTVQAVRSDLFNRAMAEDSAMQMNQPGYRFVSNKAGGTFKQLRKALDDDIKAYAEKTGGEAWETYDLANKIYAEGKQIFNKAEILKGMRNNPEKIVDILVQPKSPTTVQFARKALGNEFFETHLKPKLTSSIIDRATVNGNFDPALMEKVIGNYGETLNAVYYPGELTFLKNATAYGLRLKNDPLVDKYFPRLVKALETRPSAITKLIIMPKNVETIRKAKVVLSPSTWQDVERNFLEELLTVNKPIAGEATEFISPAKFETNVFKFSDETLKAALSGDNYKAVKDLALLSKYVQTAEKMAGNPSGTAQNVIAWGQGAMIWRDPTTGLLMAFSPPVFAKLYFSKFGRKLFVEGFKTAAHTPKGIEIATKLGLLIANQNKKDKFAQEETK